MSPPEHRCELVFGYLHCVGRTQYHGGYAVDEESADRWARRKSRENGGRVRVPEADPVRWCPVGHCHMKRQRPWFGYRSADGRLTIRSPENG